MLVDACPELEALLTRRICERGGGSCADVDAECDEEAEAEAPVGRWLPGAGSGKTGVTGSSSSDSTSEESDI